MSSPLDRGDYWDTIEAALTSLPETNRLREPALASFDHLKDRVTNSNHMALVNVAKAAEENVWMGEDPEVERGDLQRAWRQMGEALAELNKEPA